VMPSPRPGNARQARAGWEYAFGTVAHANPVVATWHWRYELLGTAGLAAIWLSMSTAAAAWVTGGLVAGLTVIACFPGGRKLLAARAWCIVTPHRVRVGCAQAWIHSRYGKLPFLMMTRSQPFGERVYLWCRAGVSAADFSSARQLLAAACWAKDVQINQHTHHAHLVALDVIRRDRPAAPNGLPWYDTGRPDGSLSIPAPRLSADDSFQLATEAGEEPVRWIRV